MPIFAIISRLTTFTASAKGHGAGEPFAGAAFKAPHPQRHLHLAPSPPAAYERQAVMEEYELHSEAQVAGSGTIHTGRPQPGPARVRDPSLSRLKPEDCQRPQIMIRT